MKDRKFHASIVGVPEDADTKLIRRAFRKKALELHPDKHGGSEKAKEEFQQLNESYRFLLDNPPVAAEQPTDPAGMQPPFSPDLQKTDPIGMWRPSSRSEEKTDPRFSPHRRAIRPTFRERVYDFLSRPLREQKWLVILAPAVALSVAALAIRNGTEPELPEDLAPDFQLASPPRPGSHSDSDLQQILQAPTPGQEGERSFRALLELVEQNGAKSGIPFCSRTGNLEAAFRYQADDGGKQLVFAKQGCELTVALDGPRSAFVMDVCHHKTVLRRLSGTLLGEHSAAPEDCNLNGEKDSPYGLARREIVEALHKIYSSHLLDESMEESIGCGIIMLGQYLYRCVSLSLPSVESRPLNPLLPPVAAGSRTWVQQNSPNPCQSYDDRALEPFPFFHANGDCTPVSQEVEADWHSINKGLAEACRGYFQQRPAELLQAGREKLRMDAARRSHYLAILNNTDLELGRLNHTADETKNKLNSCRSLAHDPTILQMQEASNRLVFDDYRSRMKELLGLLNSDRKKLIEGQN